MADPPAAVEAEGHLEVLGPPALEGVHALAAAHLRFVWNYLATEHMFGLKIPNGSKLSEPDKSKRLVGCGRIVASKIEAPNLFANLL